MLTNPHLSLWVHASAGTGKTTQLVNRYQGLLDNGFSASQIICITFTNNAAQEMVDRIQQPNVRIQTIHGLCHSILSQALPNKIDILDDSEKEHLINQAFYKAIAETYSPLFKQFSIYYIQKIVYKIFQKTYILANNNYRIQKTDGDSLIDLEDIILPDSLFTKTGEIRKKLTEIQRHEAEQIYDRMQRKKTIEWLNYNYEIKKFIQVVFQNYLVLKKDKLDYQDLILKTTHMLYDDNFRYMICRHIKHLLLDEAQDTNCYQWDLINLLTAHLYDDPNECTSLFVVGDEKQSIYGFQDSHPDYMRHQLRYYKELAGDKLQVIHLNVNYRSCPEIIDFVSQTLNVPFQKCARQETGLVQYIQKEDIKRIIQELVVSGMQWNDIMILCRKRNQAYNFMRENLSDFPLSYDQELPFIEIPEIRDLLYFFYFMIDDHDERALFYILQSVFLPKVGHQPLNEEAIHGLCYNRMQPLWEQIQTNHENLAQSLGQFKQSMQSSDDIVNLLNNNSEYMQIFAEKVQKYELKNIEACYQWFSNFPLKIKEKVTQEDNAIRLMTIHGSKGLQSKVVFFCSDFGKKPVHDLWWNRDDFFIPPSSYLKHEKIEKIRDFHTMQYEEEQQRLVYVGYTRAKDKLYIINN